MRKCIWCQRTENETPFEKKAHTIPKSLGGKRICKNVCDSCNHYFGSPKPNEPAPELVLKEILNISKFYLLKSVNVKTTRYKSVYFKINFETFKIKLKLKYSFKVGYQEMLGRQFRKGIYKVFLEERELQLGDSLDPRFNFIREFARYGIGDSPVYIQIPKFRMAVFSLPDIQHPQIRFTEESNKQDQEFRVYSYMLMGHNFLIPTSLIFNDICIEKYKNYLKQSNNPFGQIIKEIKFAEDIDYHFSNLND